MIKLELRTDFDAGAAAAKLNQAVERAVSDAAKAAATQLGRDVSADTALPPRKARDVLTIKTTGPHTRAILAPASRVGLIEFGARGPEPSRGKGRGVTYRLPGGRGRDAEAFIATMPNGHRGVFRRRPGAPRLPIEEQHGPSVWRSAVKVAAAALARAQEVLHARLARLNLGGR